MKKILITGTHFTPAQATAQKLIENYSAEIVYVGRKTTREGDRNISAESKVISKMGIKFIPIITGRIQKTFSLYTFLSLFKIPIGFIQAFWFLLTEKPNVILSFGGYVSVPIVIWGWLLSIPIIIHEQTLISGLSTEICSRFADKIAVTFLRNTNSVQNQFPEKIIHTGNPVRSEILQKNVSPDEQFKKFVMEAKKENKPLIYITGGNQGSHTINKVVLESLAELNKIAFIIHQTGDSKYKDFEKSQELHQTLIRPERYISYKWIEASDLAYILRFANCAVTRAGINTLYELALAKVPAICIPFPHLYKDEQTVNAKYFEDLGLVKIIFQTNLSDKILLSEIKKILVFKIENLSSEKIDQNIIKNADSRVALETMLLVKTNS